MASLKGRESCQRFKEILRDHAEELNRWSVFRQQKWIEAVTNWLEKLSILAIGSKASKRRAAA